MRINNIIRGLSKLVQYIFIPFSVLLCIFAFELRKFLLGFKSANKMLESLDQHSIIPILKINGAKIGKNCDLGTGLVFHNCNDYKNLTIGDNCHVGKDCFFDLRGKITIGNGVVISMKNTFITHIDMTKSELHIKYPARVNDINIEDNVYIGTNCSILNGSIIRKNTLIASMSLVNTELDSFSLYVGIPSKKVKNLE